MHSNLEIRNSGLMFSIPLHKMFLRIDHGDISRIFHTDATRRCIRMMVTPGRIPTHTTQWHTGLDIFIIVLLHAFTRHYLTLSLIYIL